MTAVAVTADNWTTQAACRKQPDLWYSPEPADRNRAAHTCLNHCPVYLRCRTETRTAPCPHAVQAGTYHDAFADPHPPKDQPNPDNATCAPCGTVAREHPGRRNPTPHTTCNTPYGYRQHSQRGEEPCPGCKEANRNRKQQERDQLRDAQCGTVDGLRRHRRNGNNICDRCQPLIEIAAAIRVAVRNGYTNPDDYRRDVDTIRRMAGLHHTDKEIAGHLGLPWVKVRHMRRSNGIAAGVRNGGTFRQTLAGRGEVAA